MPKVNLIGLDGYTFQIDTDERTKFGMFEDSDLMYLKYEVSCHLSNVIKQQIYDELSIDTHIEIDDVLDVMMTSTLFRKWLDVDAKRIQLILGNTILKDELFKTSYLEDGDTINYIILPQCQCEGGTFSEDEYYESDSYGDSDSDYDRYDPDGPLWMYSM